MKDLLFIMIEYWLPIGPQEFPPCWQMNFSFLKHSQSCASPLYKMPQ